MANEGSSGGGLSVRTLIIASVASLVAAVVVREVWGPGAIIGAAVTPVIVALVSESLNRPAERVAARTSARRDDPYGLREAERPRSGMDRRVRIGLITGAAAFVLVAVGLTASELVLGGSVSGDSKTTVFGGEDGRGGDRGPATETGGEDASGTEPQPPVQTGVQEPTEPEKTTPVEPPAETTETVPPLPQETVPPDGATTTAPQPEEAPVP